MKGFRESRTPFEKGVLVEFEAKPQGLALRQRGQGRGSLNAFGSTIPAAPELKSLFKTPFSKFSRVQRTFFKRFSGGA